MGVASLYKHTLPEADSLPSAWGTRQRPIYTRQSLCRVLHSTKGAQWTVYRQRPLCRVHFIGHSAKKSGRDGECHRDGGFAECQGQALGKGTRFAERRWVRHSAKVATVLSAADKTLSKQVTFAECLARGTRQICDVYRVQWPLHSAKHVPR